MQSSCQCLSSVLIVVLFSVQLSDAFGGITIPLSSSIYGPKIRIGGFFGKSLFGLGAAPSPFGGPSFGSGFGSSHPHLPSILGGSPGIRIAGLGPFRIGGFEGFGRKLSIGGIRIGKPFGFGGFGGFGGLGFGGFGLGGIGLKSLFHSPPPTTMQLLRWKSIADGYPR
ncbi:hypothetical protein HDE_11105 [Halotydeus destructor]|nr:hypothetical protein HDE_11105 [Halotydeus destructor]